MPQIDFYILSSNDPIAIACRLLEKAYEHNCTVYVHTASEAMATQLDEKLWTMKDTSFIPHQLVSDIAETTPPIFIGFGEQFPEYPAEILMNITPELPEFATQFERIMHIVPAGEPEWLAKAREYFKDFKEQEWQINHHKI